MKALLARHGDTVAVAMLWIIGLYDVAVGAFMLLADHPGLAHGPGTLWVQAPDDALTLSLFRRTGAFSLHAGVAMLVWSALGRTRPPVLLALLLTCAVTGMGFAWTDATFFADTPYRVVKQALGGVFGLALLAHVGARLARRG
ncbi:MAG: hypothetical protein H6742_21710 [Alphaproteobacteria bacterium]|nr:hypothetical protein [Alphaproteobacteria bacterium]